MKSGQFHSAKAIDEFHKFQGKKEKAEDRKSFLSLITSENSRLTLSEFLEKISI
jgi:hypothetical protein